MVLLKMCLYSPLPILENIWKDLSMDFVLGLPKSSRHIDPIMVVVDKLSKTVHLVACNKHSYASDIAQLFFKVVKLHVIPNTVVSASGLFT